MLAGTFAYAFCGYTVFADVRHPYFMNPMIYLPLLLTGVERLKKERKPGLFIGSVFLAVVSNFYFFYMIVVLTVLYVVFRLFQWFRREEWKQAAAFVAKLAVCAVAGVLSGMTILLPVLLVFAQSARMDTGYVYSALYYLKYYENFLMSFLSYASPGEWTMLGYAVLVLIAIFSMFTRRGNVARKAGFLLLTAFLLLPFFGYMLNGFSYVSNRWCWGYSMLVAFILAAEWEELVSAARRRKLVLCGVAAVYAVLCAVLCQRTNFRDKSGLIAALAIALPSLCVLIFIPGAAGKEGDGRSDARRKRVRLLCEEALFLLLLTNIAGIAYFLYSPEQHEYISDFKKRTRFYPDFAVSESYAVRRASGEEEFFRYTGRDLIPNASLRYGLSNTQFYWSLGNGWVANYMVEQAAAEYLGHNYMGLDDRTMLCALAGVKYHTTLEAEKGKYVPYGYEPALNGKAVEKYVVYRNSYALPLGYTYDGWIPREEYEALDVQVRQEAMLQGVVLEKEPEGFAQVSPVSTAQSVDYTLRWNDKQIGRGEDGGFIVKKKNAALTFEFAGLPECETYLAIYGLTYEGIPDESNRYWTEEQVFTMQVSAADADGETLEKTFRYREDSQEHYNNRHDFYINFCYRETPRVTVTLKFPTVGIYRFERMEIVCQPMELYQSAVQELGREVLTQVDTYSDNRVYASNRVTGKIQLEKPKLLVLAVPYSSGWSAYVDGEKKELLQANTMFCALELGAGAHEIELRYRTPGLAAGIALSLAGFGMWAGIAVYCRKKYGGTEKEPDTQQGLQGV